jgi:hypothetical protein
MDASIQRSPAAISRRRPRTAAAARALLDRIFAACMSFFSVLRARARRRLSDSRRACAQVQMAGIDRDRSGPPRHR